MGLNFGGLGFSFAGTDDGAVETSDAVAESLGSVWTQLQKVGPAAIKAGGLMATGLGKVKDMGIKAGQGMGLAITSAIESAASPKLSNAFESQFLGFKKSFKAMTVGMDMSSKEAKKMERVIGGVAFGLNEDMDTAAASWAAFRKANVDVAKVLGSKGTKGAISDLTKVTTVYGIEGQQLANIMNDLVSVWDFTEERAGKLGDTVFVAGKQFNMGKEAIQAWPGIMELLDKELADFGREATPEDVERLTASIVSLGGAFKEMGGDPAESIETAKNVFSSLMGERKNVLDMFRGMGGEISDFGQRIMESTGSADSFFKLLSEDPARFMSELAKVGKATMESGGMNSVTFQRLNKTITDTLGPDVAWAIQGNWDKVAQKMEDVKGVLSDPKIKGAMVQAARDAHVVNRTAQESWDLMLQGMEARLMRISGPLRRKWVKDMKGGFNSTIGVIEKMAAEKGPIGNLTQRLLLVKDVGLSALIPAFGKLAPLFGGLATSMLPVMTALGAMGLRIGSLSKMVLGAGGLFAVFYLLKNGPEEAIKSLKELGNTLWQFVENLFPNFAKKVKPFIDDIKKLGFAEAVGNWFNRIDWAGIKDKFVAGFGIVINWVKGIPWGKILEGSFSAAKGIGGIILGLFEKIPWGSIFDALGSVVKGVGKFIQSINWKGIFSSIGKTLGKIPWGKLFKGIFEGAKSLIAGAGSLLRGFLGGVDWKGLAKGAVKGIFTLASGILDVLFSAIKQLFTADDVTNATGSALEAGLSSAFMLAIFAIKDTILGSISGLFDYIFSGEGITGKIGNLVKAVGIGLGALLILSKTFRTKFMAFMGEAMTSLYVNVTTMVAVAGSKTAGFLSGVVRGAQSAAVGIGTAMVRGARQFGNALSDVEKSSSLAFNSYRAIGMSASRSLFMTMKDGARSAFTSMKTGVKTFGTSFKTTMVSIGTTSKVAMRGIGTVASSAFRTMGSGFARVGKGIGRGLASFGKVGALMGLMEGLDQLKIRLRNIKEINENELIPSFAKTSMAGQEMAFGIGETIDSVFMGIPGMIGKMLGISKSDLSDFYYDVVGGWTMIFTYIDAGLNVAGAAIDTWTKWVTETFVVMWARVKADYFVVKDALTWGWSEVMGKISGVVVSLEVGLRSAFMSLRHGMENAITKLLLMIADKVIMAQKILPNPLVEWAKTKKADFDKAGGFKTIEAKQSQELLDLQNYKKQKAAESAAEIAANEEALAVSKAVAKEILENSQKRKSLSDTMKEGVASARAEGQGRIKQIRDETEATKALTRTENERQEYMESLSGGKMAQVSQYAEARNKEMEDLTEAEMKDAVHTYDILHSFNKRQVEAIQALAQKKGKEWEMLSGSDVLDLAEEAFQPKKKKGKKRRRKSIPGAEAQATAQIGGSSAIEANPYDAPAAAPQKVDVTVHLESTRKLDDAVKARVVQTVPMRAGI